MRRLVTISLAAGMLAFALGAATPAPAQAVDVSKPICTVAGLLSKLAGTLCNVARKPGSVLQAGRKLLGGHLGGALASLSGASTAVKAVTATAVVTVVAAWVLGGARAVLGATASVISSTTQPQLQSTWFSASYWRMAAIGALLTLPFLFAASIQSLMRSDVTLLARSAFGYLPLGLLAVSVATPLTMLLLSASDELSSLIAGATGTAPGAALTRLGLFTGAVGLGSRSSFFVFFVGLLTVAVTILLWVELLIRSAAVYVVVLMLPLFFAALVWPARRVWAVRAVELLVALILSKFTIVAVLSLGAAALDHGLLPDITRDLAGATLVLLAACSPWALLRLLPMHELAGGLHGLRPQGGSLPLGGAGAATDRSTEAAQAVVRRLPTGSGGTGAEPSAARTAVQGLDGSGPGEPSGDGTEPATVGDPEAAPAGEDRAPVATDTEGPSASGAPELPTIVFGPTSLPDPPPSDPRPADPPAVGGVGADPAPANHDRRPPAQEQDGGLL